MTEATSNAVPVETSSLPDPLALIKQRETQTPPYKDFDVEGFGRVRMRRVSPAVAAAAKTNLELLAKAWVKADGEPVFKDGAAINAGIRDWELVSGLIDAAVSVNSALTVREAAKN